MKESLVKLIRWLFDERGQALPEYALIAGLIMVVCLVAIGALGGVIATPFQDFIAGTGWGP